MLATGGTKRVKNRWRVLRSANAARFFAVESAQRIALNAPLAIAAQLILPLPQECQKNFAILRPALAAAERIDLQRRLRESQATEKIIEQKQNLRVNHWIAAPKRLGADLVKLAHPAFLRPFAPKHRPHVVKFPHRLALEHFRFDIRAHHTGGSLRPEGQLGRLCLLRAPAVPVIEGVHLLLDDIGSLTDGPAEQLGLLQNRNADLGKRIGAKYLARRSFHGLPKLHFAGQNIRKTLNACNLHRRSGERPIKTP